MSELQLQIYKTTDNVWYFGGYEGKAGEWKRRFTGNKVNFKHINSSTDLFIGVYKDGIDISKILDANGDAYADIATFKTATAEFFADDDRTGLSSLIAAVQNSGGTTYGTMQVEITRPANQTPYSAGDVIADVSAAFKQFANVSKGTGTGVHITRVRLQTDDTAVAGLKFNVHLYKEAPTFIADNAAFSISYANATKRSGNVPVLMGTGNQNTVGMNDYNQMIIKPTARDIFFILETVSGFTPSANSTKWTVQIDYELSNA